MHFHCVTSRPKIFHNCGLFDANAKILLHAEIVTKFSLNSFSHAFFDIFFSPPLFVYECKTHFSKSYTLPGELGCKIWSNSRVHPSFFFGLLSFAKSDSLELQF